MALPTGHFRAGESCFYPLPCTQGRGQGEGRFCEWRTSSNGPSPQPSPLSTGEREQGAKPFDGKWHYITHEVAVKLAKRLGARVLAAASGEDGVALVNRLGADAVIDGHKDDIVAATRQFAPNGLDAALLTAGGHAAEQALQVVRDGGRVAYPNGVEPKPSARLGITVKSYDGIPSPQAIAKLNQLIDKAPFDVHVARTFSLDQVDEAHRALSEHFVGKLALRPSN